MSRERKKASNKKRTTKKAGGKNKRDEKNSHENDIKGIIYIGLGILMAIAIYTNLAGTLSILSREYIYRFIGVLAFVMPIYLIYYGIGTIKFKGNIEYTRKLVGFTLLTITMGLFFGTMRIQTIDIEGFGDSLRFMMRAEGINLHGGFLGHLIAYPLSRLIGYIGSYILYVTIAAISIILCMDVTLYDLYMKVKEKFTSSEPKRKAKKERAIEKTLPNIKVPSAEPTLDEELSQENFIKEINNKIQILDFMRNSELKDEEEEKLQNIDIDNLEVDTSIDDDFGPLEFVDEEEKPVEVMDFSTVKDGVKVVKPTKTIDNKDIAIDIHDEEEAPEVKEYQYPKLDLLKVNTKLKMKNEDRKELMESADKLVHTLGSFGVEAKVVHVTKGPSVTRFEIQPSPGVKVSKIVNLQDDIALGLAASAVRMEAPIPGKAAIGIEVPNKKQSPVLLREVLDSTEFIESDKKLAFALGKDITGKCVVGDLSEMPHMLIAGATGSGKSVCINSLIVSLLYKYSPQDVKLLMIDPKVVELSVYNGIPHLLIPVVTDPKKAAAALNWAVNEMDKRYELFTTMKVKNIKSFNALYEKGIIKEKLPYVVLVVDELADLMMTCPGDVEDYICRLAQKARAAGIHLIIATQRPSVDVITGVIKANIPSRVSFAVSSGTDSRTILDQTGAEKLLGRGDMLYSPMGANKPMRIQGAFISEEEVENVVEFIKSADSDVNYQDEIMNHINTEASSTVTKDNTEAEDELLDDAIKLVVEYQQASTSFIQRKLRVGFNRASRIMDELEAKGIISEKDGSRPRQVLIGKDDSDHQE